MEVYSTIKKMLRKELEKIASKGELTAGSLDVVWKLLDAAKNTSKIEMYEQYADEGKSHNSYRRGMSYDDNYAYDDDYSERRGRDRMGRYTSRDSGNYSGNDVGRNGYSMHDRSQAKHEMLEEMHHKMRTASPKEKETLKMCIEYLEETE
jgi:hypothetical protein